MRIRASEAAAGIGGRLIGPDVEFDGASFDSRSTQPGQLFVPIVAERNGHEFIGVAREAGAPVHLTSEPDPYRRDGTAIEVADTGLALLALAGWARRRLEARVVGITGSVGKTSTKDLMAAACGAGRRTRANERSFNNDQGLPVTILNAPDDTEVLILEMGMRGFGHISRLCEVARPDIGVVTVVGEAHTELVGGIDGVARAKGELVEALPASGTAVLNADDPRVVAMAARTGAEVITFGADGDVRVSDVVLDNAALAGFTVDTPWGRGRVRLAVPGRHMVTNAAAALAVAGIVGVDLAAAIDALSTATVSGMRMEVTTAPSGATIVNDAYNANPTSMRAALDALAAMRAERHVAVLGVMAEIEEPEPAHRQIAEYAHELGIEVIAVGTALYGIEPTDDVRSAVGDLGADVAVLVKASRAAGLERVVLTLRGEGVMG
ncbi:MAG TPA: UDP-N-acetylmuramoyl-tripeptide--D-alanyl-D-alanine ligase [Ilumatobacteraceae bacterium]|nr:UDP-N-acetylmuramoyl-tripeptide--D-alanyl-D-alanine ligase [Ilumatobacteraceae bacterium]